MVGTVVTWKSTPVPRVLTQHQPGAAFGSEVPALPAFRQAKIPDVLNNSSAFFNMVGDRGLFLF